MEEDEGLMGMLLISLLLGLAPLAGVVWIGLAGWLPTVDGLFTSLILLAMSGVFMLNALMQAKALGLIPGFGKKTEGQTKAAHGA